ncbi:MAG: cytochrome c biogenesis protein CcdA [Treponema sp.]|jgi:cytochrome c-type biogenesis protein|nr:cytochrome c biogenesis protein CcdA [Treponema sp.]
MLDNLSFFLTFATGLLSFLSLCALPLIPSYLCFISGISLSTLSREPQEGAGIELFALNAGVLNCFEIVHQGQDSLCALFGYYRYLTKFMPSFLFPGNNFNALALLKAKYP